MNIRPQRSRLEIFKRGRHSLPSHASFDFTSTTISGFELLQHSDPFEAKSKSDVQFDYLASGLDNGSNGRTAPSASQSQHPHHQSRTRVPLRQQHHLPRSTQRPTVSHTSTNSSSCSSVSRRSSTGDPKCWHQHPASNHEHAEPQPQPHPDKRQHEREAKQQLLQPTSTISNAVATTTATTTSLQLASPSSSMGERTSTRSSNSPLHLYFDGRRRSRAPAKRPHYCHRVYERRMVERSLQPDGPRGNLPAQLC